MTSAKTRTSLRVSTQNPQICSSIHRWNPFEIKRFEPILHRKWTNVQLLSPDASEALEKCDWKITFKCEGNILTDRLEMTIPIVWHETSSKGDRNRQKMVSQAHQTI